jgi:WD repeat-containing protein 55
VRAVRILPTKMLGVVADHGNWPVERISIGCGMGQISIEPKEDKSAKFGKNKVKLNQDKTIGAGQQQKWWVGSVGHDDTLRMTDLEGFFREAEQAETGKGELAADVRDDDSELDASEKSEEDSQEKPEITEFDSSEQHERESSGESDIPVPKKRKRKAEKDTLNTMKKHKGKKSSAVERSFFDDL